MPTSRRGFLQFLALGAGGLVGAWAGIRVTAQQLFSQVLPARNIAPENRKWVMVIDLAKCDGCGDCTKACKKMHFIPPMQEWIKVYEITDNPATGSYFLPRTCMQCDNPPCVRGCPVDATYKRTDGIVMMDQDRCIGCRTCIAMCPYSARSFNWGEPPHTPEELSRPYSTDYNYPHRKGVVEKCIFCPEMLAAGRMPACAEACTMGAIYFGDELEDAVTNVKKKEEGGETNGENGEQEEHGGPPNYGDTIQFSQIVRTGAAFRLLEELGTEPRVYYLPPANRKYPSPEEKREELR